MCALHPAQLCRAAPKWSNSIERCQFCGLFQTLQLMMPRGRPRDFLRNATGRKRKKEEEEGRKGRAEMQSRTQMAPFQLAELKVWIRERDQGSFPEWRGQHFNNFMPNSPLGASESPVRASEGGTVSSPPHPGNPLLWQEALGADPTLEPTSRSQMNLPLGLVTLLQPPEPEMAQHGGPVCTEQLPHMHLL